MRISEWSSDVCSSYLWQARRAHHRFDGSPAQPCSEQPYRPTLRVDVDVERGGRLAEARHLLDRPAERHEPAGAGVGAHVTNGQLEVRRGAEQLGVGGADRKGAG